MVKEFSVLNKPNDQQEYKPKGLPEKEESVSGKVFGKDIVNRLNTIPNGINTIDSDGFYRSLPEPEPETEEDNFLEKIIGIFATDNQEEKDKDDTSQHPKDNITFLSLSAQRKADFTNTRPTRNIFATATN